MSDTARYSLTPAAAWTDEDLTALDLRILGLLGTYLSADNRAWPSQNTLADRVKCARESANRSLKKLIEKGYVRAQERYRNDGGRTSNLYEVLLQNITPPVIPEITPPVMSRDHTPCDVQTSHHEQPQDNNPKLTSPIDNTAAPEKTIFDFYNDVAKKSGWTVHRTLTASRRKSIAPRLKDYSVDDFKDFIFAVSQQTWSRKDPDDPQHGNWTPDLTWFCKPGTWDKHFDKLVFNAKVQRKDPKQSRKVKSTDFLVGDKTVHIDVTTNELVILGGEGWKLISKREYDGATSRGGRRLCEVHAFEPIQPNLSVVQSHEDEESGSLFKRDEERREDSVVLPSLRGERST